MKPTIVVLASGSGSNFQSVIDSIRHGTLNAHIGALITNKSDAGAIQRAKAAGIPALVMRPSDFSSYDAYETALLEEIQSVQPDLIVLAGYLLKLPGRVIAKFPLRIINIHPSLLPDYGGKGFYGHHVHRAVIADRRTVSGCTVHIVSEEFDEGPILSQRTVPVFPTDSPETLAKRVLEQEHQLLPQTIHLILHVFIA